MVISMANKIANVVTMIVNSRQFNFSRLLKQLEPRLTVIAPTTPMAYMSAKESKSSDRMTRMMGRMVATSSGCQGTPWELSLAKGRGISRSRASM